MSHTENSISVAGNEAGGPFVEVQFADFDRIQPGDEVCFSKTITAEEVETFASLSGDRNPLHMDEKFAARTRFRRRVVHGMLLANYVSALVGMRYPGPGALWSQQTFRWPAPVFVGDQVHLTLSVKHKSEGSRTLAIEVKALNQDGKVVMEGDGVVTALQERKQANELPITERVAFVSGASRGIGAAIASALASAGASVVINYRNRASAAEELCATIQSKGGHAIALQADVSDYPSVLGAMQNAREEFKHPIDLLINNAGSPPEPRPFVHLTWDEIQAILDVDVRGAFNCCQAVIPGMMEQTSGRIINIGSAFTRTVPPANWSCFLLAKSAIHTLTRCLAAELGPHGIRVNTVSPGTVETDAAAGLSERLRRVQAMQTPLRRLASPTDIAAVVAALCTSAGDFITGTDIPVCGGFQM
jgi:3-oxoacyl-[acyl-carrier protein] reductase